MVTIQFHKLIIDVVSVSKAHVYRKCIYFNYLRSVMFSSLYICIMHTFMYISYVSLFIWDIKLKISLNISCHSCVGEVLVA